MPLELNVQYEVPSTKPSSNYRDVQGDSAATNPRRPNLPKITLHEGVVGWAPLVPSLCTAAVSDATLSLRCTQAQYCFTELANMRHKGMPLTNCQHLR